MCCFKYLPNRDDKITVKPLLSGHLQHLPKSGGGGGGGVGHNIGCPLSKGFKNWAVFVND